MRRFLPIFLGLLLVGAAASAQDTRRQESRKAQLEKEIAAINRQLKDNARSSSRALTDLSLVRRKIAARQELIAESDREIRALDDSMKVRQQEIDRLQARHDTLSLYYNRLVRGAYKNRDSRLWYMYILSSENIGQAVRRFGYLKGLSRNMSEQGKRIQETAAELELEKERLAGLREEAQALRGQRQADVDALRGEEGESASLVARLEKDRRKYQDELRKKNREVEALNREIAAIIRKATAKPKSGSKSSKGGKTTSTAVDEKLSSSFAANKGRLPWPVEGTVIESYGQHYHPVYKNVKLPFNNGVTLAVSRGAQPVRPGPARVLFHLLLQAQVGLRQGRRQGEDRAGPRYRGHPLRRGPVPLRTVEGAGAAEPGKLAPVGRSGRPVENLRAEVTRKFQFRTILNYIFR